MNDDFVFHWTDDEELNQALADIGYKFNPDVMYFKNGQAFLKVMPFIEVVKSRNFFAVAAVFGFEHLAPRQRLTFLAVVGSFDAQSWSELPISIREVIIRQSLPEPVVDKWFR